MVRQFVTFPRSVFFLQCGLNLTIGISIVIKKLTLGALLFGSGVAFAEEAAMESTEADKNTVTQMESIQIRASAVDDGYARKLSSSVTKTDTPIFDTPISVQVISKEVMDDQNATQVKNALENVSGVRAQPSLGAGVGFIIRGF